MKPNKEFKRLRSLKIADQVLVCADGKLCRSTIGIIVGKRHKQIKVRYNSSDFEEPIYVDRWFKKTHLNSDKQHPVYTSLDGYYVIHCIKGYQYYYQLMLKEKQNA
jgi:hypothetical protein